jgi:hypothetical protein
LFKTISNRDFKKLKDAEGASQGRIRFFENPKIGMSDPKFDECSLIVEKPNYEITIEVFYKGNGT